jgi:hypothetical protein
MIQGSALIMILRLGWMHTKPTWEKNRKRDHQALLYAVVDASIRHIGDKNAAAAH